MISALSERVGIIINRLIDGVTPIYSLSSCRKDRDVPSITKVIELDKSISYNPRKEYDMFTGRFVCQYVHISEEINLAFLYFKQPLLDSKTVSTLFGNTSTAIHFTTIRAQTTVSENKVFNERDTLIVSTRYAESLFYNYDIRELIDYIKQLLLISVLKKMSASVKGILPNGRTYKSIDEYVKLCIVYHLYSKWFGTIELEKLYNKIEPLHLYENKDDFYDQNFSLYKTNKQITNK